MAVDEAAFTEIVGKVKKSIISKMMPKLVARKDDPPTVYKGGNIHTHKLVLVRETLAAVLSGKDHNEFRRL